MGHACMGLSFLRSSQTTMRPRHILVVRCFKIGAYYRKLPDSKGETLLKWEGTAGKI